MLEGELEVGDVQGLGALATSEEEVGEEVELLGDGEDQRAERGDVGLQGVAADFYGVSAHGEASPAFAVFQYAYALEALVVRPLVGSDQLKWYLFCQFIKFLRLYIHFVGKIHLC